MNVGQTLSVSISLPVAVSLDRRTRLEKLQELHHLGAAEQRSNDNKTVVFKTPFHSLIHSEGRRVSELVARLHIYPFSTEGWAIIPVIAAQFYKPMIMNSLRAYSKTRD